MRLRRLTLLTADVPALTAFYGERLGLPITAASAERLTLAVGADCLTFEAAPAGTAPFYHLAFDVPASALDAAADWLAAAAPLLPMSDGARIAEFPNWQARSTYALDPAGNILELIGRRPPGTEAVAAPFGAAQVRGLSEIGVVAPNLPAIVARLQAEIGLPTFARQPPTERFVVFGTDDGLLIVVPPGRAWFPTTIPADVFPLTIELEPAPGRAPVVLRLP